jgi:hypothetical protein
VYDKEKNRSCRKHSNFHPFSADSPKISTTKTDSPVAALQEYWSGVHQVLVQHPAVYCWRGSLTASTNVTTMLVSLALFELTNQCDHEMYYIVQQNQNLQNQSSRNVETKTIEKKVFSLVNERSIASKSFFDKDARNASAPSLNKSLRLEKDVFLNEN